MDRTLEMLAAIASIAIFLAGDGILLRCAAMLYIRIKKGMDLRPIQLRQLCRENAKMKELVAELTLQKDRLSEIVQRQAEEILKKIKKRCGTIDPQAVFNTASR